MENDIRPRYDRARPGVPDGTAITVLHIGEKQTAVATGSASEPDAVLVLAIGSKKPSQIFSSTRHPRLANLKTPSW